MFLVSPPVTPNPLDLDRYIFNNRVDLVTKWLKTEGSDPNLPGVDGKSALDYAVDDRVKFDIFRELFEAGARLSADGNNRPIGWAICLGIGIVPTSGYRITLSRSLQEEQLRKFQLVLKSNPKASVTRGGPIGLTPFFVAVEHRQIPIVKYLHSLGLIDWSAFSYGATDLSLLKLFLSWGGNLNGDPNEVPPLIGACTSGDPRCADLLLKKGADAHVVDPVTGETSLFFLARNQFMNSQDAIHLTRLLISKGLNLNAKDPLNHTALFVAVRYLNFDLSVEFVKRGMKDSPVHSRGMGLNALRVLASYYQEVTTEPASATPDRTTKLRMIWALEKAGFCRESDLKIDPFGVPYR